MPAARHPDQGASVGWNCSDAPWFPSDPDELYRLQLGRIDDCVRRFTGLIDRWDVVNEATEFERVAYLKAAPKHSAMWKKVGQIEFIRQCLNHARAGQSEGHAVGQRLLHRPGLRTRAGAIGG